MSPPGKLRALLATGRVANVPSVASNVWCGAALAFVFGDVPTLDPSIIARLSLAGVFLYLSGNFLNDWFDRGWDAVHRPERALPAGLFLPNVYLTVSIQFAVLGLALAAATGLQAATVALVIAGLVAVYTLAHKRSAWAVLPMGLCRALLPLLGAAGVIAWQEAGWRNALPAIALLAHIAGLSLAARGESSGTMSPRVGAFTGYLFLVPPALAILIRVEDKRIVWLAGIIPYLLWIASCDLVRRMKLRRFVSLLLAGIPLVDWIFLLPIGLSMPATPFGIACLAIPPLAVVAGLLLQKLAPAT